MSRRQEPFAVVVDEFGSAEGIVTLEDIFEQVLGPVDVGEIFETPKRHIRTVEKLGEDVYLMDGRLSISEVNEELGIDLPGKEFHTLGGMVTSRLRHIPAAGEYTLEQGYRFTVAEATERSVLKVRVEREGAAGEGI